MSHDKLHSENLNLVKETLIKNGYPLDLLIEKIAMRYKLLMSNKSFKNNINETSETKDFEKIITLLYIHNFQAQFYRIFKNSNLQIIFIYDNTI